MIYEVTKRNHETYGEVRTVTINGKIWYSYIDIAEILEIPDYLMAYMEKVRRCNRTDVETAEESGRIVGLMLINEPGIKALEKYSQSDDAKEFLQWLFQPVKTPTVTYKIFDNDEFGSIRTVIIKDDPWFVGKDVATALGYKNTKDALATHVEECDKIMGSYNTTPSIKDSMGREQFPTWINESGLYALIFGSKLESAKRFKHWVTSEVLPSIRKHGMYAVEEIINNPDTMITVLTALKNERSKNHELSNTIAIQNQRIEEMSPKVEFHDAVAETGDTILIGKFAGILSNEHGLSISQNKLFEYLRANQYLCSASHLWNKPSQPMISKGYMLYKESIRQGELKFTPLITGKGQIYFTKKILDNQEYFVKKPQKKI